MVVSQEYTISDYIAAFRRRRGMLLSTAAPVMVIAALMSMILPDKFTSYSEIDINLEGAGVRTLEPIEVTTYADQYISKLSDRALTKDNMLDLARDPAVISISEDAATESERVDVIRNSIKVSTLTQLVTSPTSGREVDLISGIRVSSVTDDPSMSIKVAEYVAELFFRADQESRTERAGSTATFLSEQMNITEQNILELEKEVADFKVTNACCLPELVNLNMSAIERAQSDIESAQPRIRTLEQNRSFIKAQIDELGQLDAGADRIDELQQEYMTLVAKYGPDHPDVNRLRREIIGLTSADTDGRDSFQIIELRIKLGEAEQKYSNQHPDVIRYRKELAALESDRVARGGTIQNSLLDNPRYIQLRGELNSIDAELDGLRLSLPALRQRISEYEDRLARTPQVESEFEAISRRLQGERDNFDNLRRRAVTARQSEALESTDIGARLTLIVAPVEPASPSGPPRLAILVIGLFLAGSLGIGSMLFAEMTDSTVRGSKDIARVLDMVPLATVPVIENMSSRKIDDRRLYMKRGMTFVVVVAILLFIFRDFF